MEDAAVDEAGVSGATALVAVARPPPASFPSRVFTAEQKEAHSTSSSGQPPMPEDPAPPTQAAAKKRKKKRVIMTQSDLNALMAVEEREPVPVLDEEWLKAMKALTPNGEQFFADRGFSLEKCHEVDNMDFAVKAQADLIAELRKQQREKGYIEMEITDDEVDEEGIRAPYGMGRRRFRPGIWKKPGGEIKKLSPNGFWSNSG